MSAIDEINYSIDNGIIYNNYRIIGMAEPYAHKPGVMTECISCGKKKRVRFSNLKNGYTKSCKCTTVANRDYKSYIGIIYQDWEIMNMIPFGNNYKNGHATVRCIHCNNTKEMLAYNLLKRIDNNKNILKCTNCMDIEKHFKLEKIREKFKSKYIGVKYKNDEIVDIICENLTTLDYCIIKCNICNRTRKVIINAFVNHRDRRITRCECEASGWNKYSKFVGETVFDDRIIKYEYSKDGKGYNRRFLVECDKCGKERYIKNVAAVVYNSQLDTRPKNFGYKICNCNKGTRSKNILDRYKHYIGEHIDGTKLTVVDLFLKVDSNGKNKVMAKTICDCSPDKVNSQWLPAILMKHTVSCGCIGRSIGEVLVRDALNELNVEYKEQVKAPNTKSIAGGNLFFDFVIRVNNKIAVIEYDGAQHYDIEAFNFGIDQDGHEEKFWRLQENDKIKNKYCADNNYKILRIKDTEYHNDYNGIKELICKFIKNL